MASQTMLVPSLVGASQPSFLRLSQTCPGYRRCTRKVICSRLIISYEVSTNSFNFTLFSRLHLLNLEKSSIFFQNYETQWTKQRRQFPMMSAILASALRQISGNNQSQNTQSLGQLPVLFNSLLQEPNFLIVIPVCFQTIYNGIKSLKVSQIEGFFFLINITLHNK